MDSSLQRDLVDNGADGRCQSDADVVGTNLGHGVLYVGSKLRRCHHPWQKRRICVRRSPRSRSLILILPHGLSNDTRRWWVVSKKV